MADEDASARPRAGPVLDRVITVDQPADVGGADTAPTPTELFVAGVASCVAFYARRYLARHGIFTDGLGVTARYEMGSHPARVTQIRIGIVPPPGLPADRCDAFLAVASHCTVHNSLDEPPSVQITVEPGDVARLRPRSALA